MTRWWHMWNRGKPVRARGFFNKQLFLTTSDVYNATENLFIICGSTGQVGNICSDIVLPQRIEHGGVCCISLSFHFVHGNCFCVHEFPG